MLILLDQDNVLADFESGFRRHWRGRFGEDAPIEGKEHIFYIAKDKAWVRGDILIDDKPTIEGSLPPLWQHRLYDAPHNRHLNVPRIVWTQPETWADLLDN